MTDGWIGVDLDGTLANYDGFRGLDHIGAPVPAMLNRVKAWLKAGIEVRIFTARASEGARANDPIQKWLNDNGLPWLQVTNVKDYNMFQLWDDRAVRVEMNTGAIIANPEIHHKARR